MRRNRRRGLAITPYESTLLEQRLAGLQAQHDGVAFRARLLESVVEQLVDGILILAAEPSPGGRRIVFANAAFVGATGYALGEIIGKPLSFFAGLDAAQRVTDLERALDDGIATRAEIVNYRKDGSSYAVDVAMSPVANLRGRRTHWICVQRDLSERIALEAATVAAHVAEAERRTLEYAAYHDGLTGLFNRAYFTERLEVALERQRDDDEEAFAVLFFDLDRFKNVNDAFGHRLGDLLLVEVAHRVQGCLRASDTLARIGGDEFAALVPRASYEEVAAIAGRVTAAIARPVELEGRAIVASASVGIADSRGSGDPGEILARADAAMYRAKAERRLGCHVVFDSAMRRRASDPPQFDDVRPNDPDARLLVAAFAPVVALAGGAVVGFSVRVRPEAESAAAVETGAWSGPAGDCAPEGTRAGFVLVQACRQWQHWRATYAAGEGLRMRVTLSPAELLRPDFIPFMSRTLAAARIIPGALEIGVREGAADVDWLAVAFTQLRGLGVRVALESFGSGGTSFDALRRLRFDTLTIDAAFVARLDSRIDREIVRGIAGFGQRLGIDVGAEGIETARQFASLRALGCRLGQGRFVLPPLPAAQIPAALVRMAAPIAG